MICCICDAPRTLLINDGGREIALTPVIKVWCCDNCIDAILFNACQKAFHERFTEVNS